MSETCSSVASLKASGNALMKEGKYVEAIIRYSDGITLEPDNPVLYSNRALAFHKLEQYFFAVKDAETTIQVMPNWTKGYYRKGQAEQAVERFDLAIKSYQAGLKVCPADEILKNSLCDVKKQEEAYFRWKGTAMKKYAIIGGVLGSLLVIGDMLLQPTNAFIRIPLFRGLIVTLFSVFGYFIASMIISMQKSSKASLLLPPDELITGSDLDYNPATSKSAKSESTSETTEESTSAGLKSE